MPRRRGPAAGRVLPRVLGAAVALLLVVGILGAAGVGTEDEDAPGRAVGPLTGPAGVVAGDVVFQDGDFPSGWHEDRREGAAGSTVAVPGTGATGQFCPALAGDPTAGRLSSEAESFFTSTEPGSFSFAGAFVGVADEAAVAPAGFEFLSGETFLRCAADGFAKGFLEGGAEGITLTEEASEPIPVAALGQVAAGQTQGRRLTYTARGPEFEVPLFVDLAVVHAGASVGLAFLGAYREPLPPEFELKLLDSLLGRMATTG